MIDGVKKYATLVATTAAVAGSSGYVVYDQYQDRRAQEFIVLFTDSRKASEHGKKWGKVKRRIKDLNSVVVESSNRTVRGLLVEDRGVIVEPVVHSYTALPTFTCECTEKPTDPIPPPPPPPDPAPPPPPGDQVVDYSIEMIKTVPKFVQNNASSVKVCVTDTGVSDHPDLKITRGANFTGGDMNDFHDALGHGTHVVGAIAAVYNSFGVVGASQAQILVAKVLNDQGSGSNEQVAAGVAWCIQQGAQIISMSLGGPFPSRVLETVITEAGNKGIWVFAAAGNNGGFSISYPSGFLIKNLFSVSAIDKDGNLATFSSYGKVDLTAPRVQTLSTYLGGTYKRLSGTSMSTPVAAGCAAMYRALNRPMVVEDRWHNALRFGQGLCTGDGL